MAHVYGIKKRLEKFGIAEKTAKEIIGNGNLIDITAKMETSLEPDMMIQILESCACGTAKKYLEQSAKIGKTLAGKALEEKISLISSDSEEICGNADGYAVFR